MTLLRAARHPAVVVLTVALGITVGAFQSNPGSTEVAAADTTPPTPIGTTSADRPGTSPGTSSDAVTTTPIVAPTITETPTTISGADPSTG